MNVEQPELGNVGVDTITVMLAYSWHAGWRCRLASRSSGAAGFREETYDGRDEAELHALISDYLAELMGLI